MSESDQRIIPAIGVEEGIVQIIGVPQVGVQWRQVQRIGKQPITVWEASPPGISRVLSSDPN